MAPRSHFPNSIGKMPNVKVNLGHLVPEIREALKTEEDLSRRWKNQFKGLPLAKFGTI